MRAHEAKEMSSSEMTPHVASTCNRTQPRLQPCAIEAVAPCDRGYNPI